MAGGPLGWDHALKKANHARPNATGEVPKVVETSPTGRNHEGRLTTRSVILSYRAVAATGGLGAGSIRERAISISGLATVIAVLTLLMTVLLGTSGFRAAGALDEDGILRINVGGPEHIDAHGHRWSEDRFAVVTAGGVAATHQSIKGASHDGVVLQSYRFGTFGYTVPVPNGSYEVTLHFADFGSFQSVAEFNVLLGGQPALSGLNIAAEAGSFSAVTKTLETSTESGKLEVAMVPVQGDAILNALEIRSLSGNGTRAAHLTTVPGAGAIVTTPEEPMTSNEASASTTTSPSKTSEFSLVFREDFDRPVEEGSFLKSYENFYAYPTHWKDTAKVGQYNPGILSVRDGLLHVRLHTKNGTPQVAAVQPRINQLDAYNQLYGRYEVRFRADPVVGYKTAWLLWPKSEEWPRDGEIDFPEGELTGRMTAFTHFQNGTFDADQEHFSTSAGYQNWHTAAVEWRPNSVTYLLDGKVIGKTTKRVPNTPMRWVLQNETVPKRNIPADATGNIQIDYVAVWKYDGAK